MCSGDGGGGCGGSDVSGEPLRNYQSARAKAELKRYGDAERKGSFAMPTRACWGGEVLQGSPLRSCLDRSRPHQRRPSTQDVFLPRSSYLHLTLCCSSRISISNSPQRYPPYSTAMPITFVPFAHPKVSAACLASLSTHSDWSTTTSNRRRLHTNNPRIFPACLPPPLIIPTRWYRSGELSGTSQMWRAWMMIKTLALPPPRGGERASFNSTPGENTHPD